MTDQKDGREFAFKVFSDHVQKLETFESISEFCQTMLVMCSKVIHGIEGEEFKKVFLTGAINDKEKIELIRVN